MSDHGDTLAKWARVYRAWCPACEVLLEGIASASQPPSHVCCPRCGQDREIAGSERYRLKGALEGRAVGRKGKT